MGKSKAKQAAPVERAAVDAKRAEAYRDLEPHLRDCVRWSELAEVLSLDHDRSHYDMVVYHLAEKMKKLVANYYALDFRRHEAPPPLDHYRAPRCELMDILDGD